MTSQYRHRRTSNPATAFPALLEPGEIAVNTANLQLALGDANAASLGAPLILMAVRPYSASAQYAVGDFVVQAGALYRCQTSAAPGAFVAGNWQKYEDYAATKGYIDTQDAAITAAYQAADSTLTTNVTGKVAKVGDTMTGPLVLPAGAPTLAAHAANKKYVDDSIAAGPGAPNASGITSTPVGNVQATNVQAAIAELDAEKAPITSPSFLGTPIAPTPTVGDNSTKVATTAFCTGMGYNGLPAMDANANAGTFSVWARGDHVHPTDTSRAPVNSPTFTGVPAGPTAALNTNTTQLATTAFVMAQPATSLADGIVTYIKMASSAIATLQQYINNTAQKILTTDQVWGAAANIGTPSDSSGTINCDFGLYLNFYWGLSGAGRTVANPTNPKVGQSGLILIGTGTGTITNWGTSWKFAGGTKPVTTATGGYDWMWYTVYNSSYIICSYLNDIK